MNRQRIGEKTARVGRWSVAGGGGWLAQGARAGRLAHSISSNRYIPSAKPQSIHRTHLRGVVLCAKQISQYPLRPSTQRMVASWSSLA